MNYWDDYDCEVQCEEFYDDEEYELDEETYEGNEDSFLDGYWESLTELGDF